MLSLPPSLPPSLFLDLPPSSWTSLFLDLPPPSLLPSLPPSLQAYEQGRHPDSSSIATVVLQVEDVNEPPEFLSSYYSTLVSEGAQPGEILFAGITAVDQDVVSA